MMIFYHCVIYLCIFIYLCYLKFVHGLSNDASSSSDYTNSIQSLITEELMTREECVKEWSVVLV
jgi:hypothetical protein